MVKLELKSEYNIFGKKAFYFHNMDDCEAFMYVFKDHWCNVPWKAPVEAKGFPEASASEREAMDKDPKQRAERSLSWGFNLVRYYQIEDTDEQKAFVRNLIAQQNW